MEIPASPHAPSRSANADSASGPVLLHASPNLGTELRRYLKNHRVAVVEQIADGTLDCGPSVGRRYASTYDGILSALFHAARAAMQSRGHWVPMVMAAVGSYGRRVLSPYSDLDVRLLCEGDTASAAPAAEALLYPLWDAGLDIGHQIVTYSEVVELARQDLPTATALLDWRTITGDSTSAAGFLESAFREVFAGPALADFVERMESSTRARHKRFGDSVFLLEPDVKNGAGGLRDLDIAHWAARARWRVADFSELVKIRVFDAREYAELDEARSLLARIRNLLHVTAGRRADRLSFDLQELLSERLGYGTGGAAVERFMSDYYRRARTIARARDVIMARARPAQRRRARQQVIGAGCKLDGEAVSIVDEQSLHDDPALALRIYDEAIRRHLPVHDFARHLVTRATLSPRFCHALRASTEASELFLRLVCVIQTTRLKRGSVLFDLHETGLLVAMIPEFSPVVGRVHHDIYHVYTVDVHSVAAVDQLRALCRGDLASEHPLASRLAAELPRRRVLFFATLLHDVGKDLGGKDHARRGSELARSVLERLGASESDIEEVQHHVLTHLNMYRTATRRDVEDPSTVAEFCAEVRGQEALRELYLLTLADVTTTSPKSMTSWKRRMLDALYVAAHRFLAGDAAPRSSTRMEACHASVRRLCSRDSDQPFLEHFLSGMPERYFYANEAAAIAEHAEFAASAQGAPVRVRVGGDNAPYRELWVVAEDRPGLLAMIAATFNAARLKILSAQVYSWIGPDGRSRSLDIFWVRGSESLEYSEAFVSQLESALQKLLRGDTDPSELAEKLTSSRSTWRPTPPVETKVNVDNHSATNHTVIEVVTRDRPALLYFLSDVIARLGLSIWLAKTNTEGERVADVFYVTDESGGKIVDRARLSEAREALEATVTHLEAVSS